MSEHLRKLLDPSASSLSDSPPRLGAFVLVWFGPPPGWAALTLRSMRWNEDHASNRFGMGLSIGFLGVVPTREGRDVSGHFVWRSAI